MQFVRLAATIVLTIAPANDDRDTTLLQNGGYDRSTGWDTGVGVIVSDGNPGACLRFNRSGGARQDVLVARRPLTLTVAVDIKVTDVAADEGKPGYAFAAIYQTDEYGKLVTAHDFAQLTGTNDWQRYEYTFQADSRADFVSVRCGIFQATGIAFFDNWILVQGTEAKMLSEAEATDIVGRRAPTAAVFHETEMPVVGAPSSAKTIAAILDDVGIQTRVLPARELADPMSLNTKRFDLVVLPTGQTFPVEARLTLVHFLRNGGDFISTGGYAFNDLRRLVGDVWMDEREVAQKLLDEAMAEKRSLLPDGGFEQRVADRAEGGPTGGLWQSTSDIYCAVVEDGAYRGDRCAKVSIPQAVANPGAQYYAELTGSPGTEYQVSGWMRTHEVTGPGMAFIALYQYDSEGKLLEFCDFANVHNNRDWKRYDFRFTANPNIARMQVKLGLYRALGTAWFDDIRVCDVTGIRFVPINTATGHPDDGLTVSPAQIGVFDPSFPLKRAQGMRTATGQRVVKEPIDYRHELRGWAASGVIGYDHARWIPLLETFDRYGRPRGAAAAMTLNYGGFYSGSCWAYFGIESVDIFQDKDGPMARLLGQAARFMARETYLRNLKTDHRLYHAQESVQVSVVVDNRGRSVQQAAVRFSVRRPGAADSQVIGRCDVRVEPEDNKIVEVVLPKLDDKSDIHQIDAELLINGEPVDQMSTGFVVADPAVVSAGSTLRFNENYFTLDERPTFLFGTDTYSRTYNSAAENPLTWLDELSAARDVGMNLYENLQYTNPGHKMADDDWRSFLAMTQLTQRLGLAFMPGMLIGHNVAISNAELTEQSSLCRQYAEHLGDTPGLLYYINGDYQMRLAESPDVVRSLWNQWLERRYETTERLQEVWGGNAVGGELGEVDFPPPNSGRWDDVAAVDRLRFQTWLMRRWNEAHVDAVRDVDIEHPITSEYYSMPFAGIDLPMTIDGQDVSNIGYFDLPVADLDNLPLRIRFNDLRARGKGVSLGEYGVKTHPAWTTENGAQGYHIVRTEEQQKQLFVTVAHYALGLGASKVQNWCLRDAQARVFPWGIFYPNQLVPKDVAYVHRNLSLVWRHFRPRYTPPRVTACLANQLRLGNDEDLGPTVAYRTIADLLALHYDFNCIDDHPLDDLPTETEVLIYPSPFALRDDTYDRLKTWVAGGGTVLITGDCSYDADRQRTRTSRLEELAGVRFATEKYPNVARDSATDVHVVSSLKQLDGLAARPCIRVQPGRARVLAAAEDGTPILLRGQFGKGTVYYCTDPIELADGDEAQSFRRKLYATVLTAANQKPLAVEPNQPWLHTMAQRTDNGTVHVVFNTKLEEGTEPIRLPTTAGIVQLTTRNRWPALVAATRDGSLVATVAYGAASIDANSVIAGRGLKAALSLDGKDLRKSAAVLVAPFEPGSLRLSKRPGSFVASIGEFRGGQWTELERVSLAPGELDLDIDADRATCLILVCKLNTMKRWTEYLTEAMCRPDRIVGY